MGQPKRMFHSQRGSKSHSKPIKRGTVAMDLNEDIKKFKTWQKLNKEFERRLTRKEQENVLFMKKLKDEKVKYPSTLWRGSRA